MKKKVVIIGSNEHQNPLIESAKAMGYETHVFSWQTGDVGEKTADVYYPISITNKQAILDKCREIKPLGILSMASDLAAITVGYLAENLNCIGNSSESIEICTNKILFRKRMQEKGIQQPCFVEVGDVFPEEKIEKMHFPVVVKPCDRSGNRGVVMAKNRREMIKALIMAKEYSFERKAIVEEYISGEYYSCECYTENGKHTIVAITKRRSIEFQNRFLDYEREQTRGDVLDKEDESVIFSVLEAVGMKNGASSVEFIKNEDGIWVIEVMPSMYGDFIATDLVPLTHDFDYVGKVISIACGDERLLKQKPDREEAKTAKVRFVLSQEDYKEYEQKLCEGKIVHASRFDEAAYIPAEMTGIQYGYFIEKTER